MRSRRLWTRPGIVVRESLTANAKVATVLGSIPASSDTVESEGADEAVVNKVCTLKVVTSEKIGGSRVISTLRNNNLQKIPRLHYLLVTGGHLVLFACDCRPLWIKIQYRTICLRPAAVRLAWNRFPGSINVYKYGLCNDWPSLQMDPKLEYFERSDPENRKRFRETKVQFHNTGRLLN